MIARVWVGRTPAAEAGAYAEYLDRTGVRDLRATPGNEGVFVLRRVGAGRATFTVLSLWRSIEDVRAFAGDDVDGAVYYPEDGRYLEELTPTLEHHEVLAAPA